jgi:hypothetical protein
MTTFCMVEAHNSSLSPNFQLYPDDRDRIVDIGVVDAP